MSPAVLVSGLLLFAVALGVHVLLWRLAQPANDVLAFFLVFGTVPAAYAAYCAFAAAGAPGSVLFNALATILLYSSFAAVYISSYPAAQAHSPSLAIILLISSSPGKILTEEEIV